MLNARLAPENGSDSSLLGAGMVQTCDNLEE
jgi:hypothetical protein